MSTKKQVFNPFSTLLYLGDDYYCPRINDENTLIDAWKNGRNVTLTSIRRMGKTGMIKHIFDVHKEDNYFFVYADIYETTTIGEFTKVLAEAVFKQKMTPFSKRVMDEIRTLFSAIRPVLTTDALTGEMEFMVDIKPKTEEVTLGRIFEYLENAEKECVVAIDEFQAIADYKDCKMEAVLRKHVQQLKNVRFVFSGSKRHVMTEMFMSSNRPFYQSTQMMQIEAIAEDEYRVFATRHLERQNQTISQDAFHELYAMVEGHTWYIQTILNRLYQRKVKNIDEKEVRLTVAGILQENEASYQMFCELITETQRNVLKAIAKDGEVEEINSGTFLKRHSLGAGSSVRSAVKALMDKNLIAHNNGKYTVDDRFFGMWLARKFP